MKSPFLRDPLQLLEEDAETARKDLKTYMESYTGSRFDTLADAEHPNRITQRDIVAVSMLSVDVPAATTIWLLEWRRRSELGESGSASAAREEVSPDAAKAGAMVATSRHPTNAMTVKAFRMKISLQR